jgi:hypothetical protein
MLTLLTRNILIAAALARSVTADFHLMYSESWGVDYFSCPSNYYSADCWCNGNRRSSSAPVETASDGEYKVTLDNVCGVAAMDFWWRPNGANGDDRIQWQAYIPNADGHVVATCYPNGDEEVGPPCPNMPEYTVYDSAVCYSEICGSA